MNKYTQLAEKLEQIKKTQTEGESLMHTVRLGALKLEIQDSFIKREITIFEYKVLLRELDEKPIGSISAEHPFFKSVSPA